MPSRRHRQPTQLALPWAPPPAARRSIRGRRAAGNDFRTSVVLLALTAAFLAGGIYERAGLLPGHPVPPAPRLPAFEQAANLLLNQYVGRADLDLAKLQAGAIAGLVGAVGDTGHTAYLSPDALAHRDAALSGTFAGVGIVLAPGSRGPVIARVLPDSPAATAQLPLGGTITAIDGAPASTGDPAAIVGRIRGAAGSRVTLTIEDRGGAARDYVLTRAAVSLPSVSAVRLPGTTIGLLDLSSFATGAATSTKTALADLRRVGVSGLVLDLRGNPGGYVSEATTVASLFLPQGSLIYISEDAAGVRTEHRTDSPPIAADLPLVVVTDGSTASAAEIVTGALHDARRAPVVGQTTFGTGTVVGTFPLPGGGALAIGVEGWVTPAGHRLWHTGLTPDVLVARAADQLPTTTDQIGAGGAVLDNQLAQALAVLRSGHWPTPERSSGR